MPNIKTQATGRFTVIIPTYTGEDHIADCLNSILNQDNLNTFAFDVIVVIDGQNVSLRAIIDDIKKEFIHKGIDLSVYQFRENRGRFEARLKGARESSNDYLLFLDDRNILANNYFVEVIKANKKALIPNVLESSHPQFVAKTMYYVRKKIYGNTWGAEFTSYDITEDNFERSSKGTTSFWVEKQVFIKSCSKISKNYSNLKTISDDTKVMRQLIEDGVSIYRSSEAKIYYQPRKSALKELEHIFNRGPIFMDYYLRPGTRFYVPLILFYVLVLLLLTTVFTLPLAFFLIVGLLLLSALVIAMTITGFSSALASIFSGLILIALSFSAGLVKGLVLKMAHL